MMLITIASVILTTGVALLFREMFLDPGPDWSYLPTALEGMLDVCLALLDGEGEHRAEGARERRAAVAGHAVEAHRWIAAARQAKVPLLAGWNADEARAQAGEDHAVDHRRVHVALDDHTLTELVRPRVPMARLLGIPVMVEGAGAAPLN